MLSQPEDDVIKEEAFSNGDCIYSLKHIEIIQAFTILQILL